MFRRKGKGVLASCFLAATAAMALQTGPVWGATVTVSTVSGLEAAVRAALPGDVIELEDGVYQMTKASGIMVQDKPELTIRSKSGNRSAVILQGKGINDISTEYIFMVYRSPYFTLQNMTLKNVYWHHVQINDGSSHFVLRNLVMVDAGEAPVKVTSPGGNGPFSDYGLIEGCTLSFTNYGTRDVVEGIDIIASVGTVIRDCKFYRVRKPPTDWDVGWGCFAKCNAQDTIIENNYFEDCDIAISFGNGGCPADYARYGDITYQHRGGIIRNNVVNRTKDNAIHINSSNNFKIYNNTTWSTYSGGSSLDVRYNSYGEVKNNIFNQSYRLRDSGQAVFAANILYGQSTLFADQPNGDFHLVPTATAAIDKGVNVSAYVPYDMDVQSRPQGAAMDIGADEYVCIDADGDGYYAKTACGTGVDCDDSRADVNPGATEVCDGVDNDCDGVVDEDACTPVPPPPPAPPAVPEGAIAYWPFDEGVGTNVADATDYNHDGVISGAVWTMGKSGYGLSFDGNDRITVPGFNLGTVTEFSVEMWVKRSNPALEGELLSQWTGAWGNQSQDVFRLNLRGNTRGCSGAYPSYGLQFALASGWKPVLRASGTSGKITDTAWHHVAAVFYRSSRMDLYVDGRRVTGALRTVNCKSTRIPAYINNLLKDLVIGSGFSGVVDEVVIYNRALTDTQVNNRFTQTAVGK